MNVVVVRDPRRPHLGGNLNVRQLLNPIFYAPVDRHPDAKRQRKARLRARALRQARELKAAAVPLPCPLLWLSVQRTVAPLLITEADRSVTTLLLPNEY